MSKKKQEYTRPCAYDDCKLQFTTTDKRKMYHTHQCKVKQQALVRTQALMAQKLEASVEPPIVRTIPLGMVKIVHDPDAEMLGQYIARTNYAAGIDHIWSDVVVVEQLESGKIVPLTPEQIKAERVKVKHKNDRG